jgi:hypothetical protein
MPDEHLRFSYDRVTGIGRITLTGPWPAGEGHSRFVQELAAMGAPQDAPTLIDVRGVESGTEPHYADLTYRVRDRSMPTASRRAYLARPGTQYGVARMIKALTPTDVDLEVFTDEAEALAWLTRVTD